MNILIYGYRVLMMYLVTWLGIRLIGKKSIAQLTTNDLAGILLLTTIASEPLVHKVATKATEGILLIAGLCIVVGKISLKKRFYNVEMRPTFVIKDGKILKEELKNNHMNIPTLLSELRLVGYANVQEIAYAIIEPNGKLSVFPKAPYRQLYPLDFNLTPPKEQITIPLIIDGEIQYNNLKFIKKTTFWLKEELNKQNIQDEQEVLLAQLDSQERLYVNLVNEIQKEDIPPIN